MTDLPATGPARRRRRLTDDETRQRMLDTALAMVEAAGLTVSLEHIRFEDVIRDADVARAAVYRRWPYKDLFFADLLKELARAAPAAIGDDGADGEQAVRDLVRARLDLLDSPGGRRRLLVELLREGASRDFEAMHASPRWRTYVALHATFLSLDDGELRTEIQTALGQAERDLVRAIARSYAGLADLLGLRPLPGLAFEDLAAQVSATMRGFVITAKSLPELAERRPRTGAFGVPGAANWSQPALGVTAVALALLEPDPRVTWDAERVERARQDALSASAGASPADAPTTSVAANAPPTATAGRANAAQDSSEAL